MKKYTICILFLCFKLTPLFSQTADSLHVNQNNFETLELFKKLKIQGLIQTQFQRVDSAGSSCLSGGNFERNSNNRFMLRRAQFKVSYHSAQARFSFQVNATEKGIKIDEAFVSITLPKFNAVSLTSGIFNRPFGYEISYSSSLLESDERSRIVKTLFPDEKDLGVMLSVQPKSSSPWNFISFDAGFFNGTGPAQTDFDSRKDFISHLHFKKNILSDKVTLGVGVSWYMGGFSNQRTIHYNWDNGFFTATNDTLALSEQNLKGFDAQLLVQTVLGTTNIRCEYIFGRQAGTFETSRTPSVAPVDNKGNPAASVLRDFNGGYIIIAHDISKTKIQAVFKFDWYDPNRYVSAMEVGDLTKTGVADIRYRTFGFGLNYLCNSNIRLLAFYNVVKNETTRLMKYTTDLNDNIFTLRLQYKF